MRDVAGLVQEIWNDAKAAKAKTRAQFSIERAQVDEGAALGSPFVARNHYFQVVAHEMFLARRREWFVTYDPMVLAVSEYIYDTEVQAVPFVVGPSMLSGVAKEIPEGMIFRDTPVSGLHPYQGGAFILTVVLYKVLRKNNAERLLRLVEGVSKSLGPANAMAAYLKVAGTVTEGVQALLGLNETVPVVGCRLTINPQADHPDPLTPDYRVLVDEDSEQLAKGRLRVRGSRLFQVTDTGAVEEYRDRDFVLFRIAQAVKRTDERTLPFFPIWKTAQDFAARGDDSFWKEAKAHFNTLSRSLLASPDLTAPDAARLRLEYLEELKQIRKQAVENATLAASAVSDAEKELRRAGAELDTLDAF